MIEQAQLYGLLDEMEKIASSRGQMSEEKTAGALRDRLAEALMVSAPTALGAGAGAGVGALVSKKGNRKRGALRGALVGGGLGLGYGAGSAFGSIPSKVIYRRAERKAREVAAKDPTLGWNMSLKASRNRVKAIDRNFSPNIGAAMGLGAGILAASRVKKKEQE